MEKVMDFPHDGDESGDEASFDIGKEEEQFRKHYGEQIQKLEEFLKDCAHLTKDDQPQLSTDLELSSYPSRFWFQDKISEIKLQNEKEENDALRVENEKLYEENQTLKEMIMDPFCTKCHNKLSEEETKKLHLLALSAENAKLKKELVAKLDYLTYLRNKGGM